MQPTQPSSAATTPEVTPSPISSLRAWRESMAARAAQRLTGALSAAAAKLRTVDTSLAQMATQDWTARALAQRLDVATREARKSVEREASIVLERADHVPVAVVEYLLRRSRDLVGVMSSTMDRGATRLAARKAEAERTEQPPVARISAA